MYKKMFEVINIRSYLVDSAKDEEELKREFSHFTCPLNKNVERFLKEQAIEFVKRNQSVTYLVFSKEEAELIGYFTLTVKPIIIKRNILSKNMQRKILRIGEQSEENQTIHLSAFLIAQISKNITNNANRKITGQELLEIAINKIREVQYLLGGIVVFLEAEENEKLLTFYEVENHFTKFNIREASSRKSCRLVQMLKTL